MTILPIFRCRQLAINLVLLCLLTAASLVNAAPDTTPYRSLPTDRGRLFIDRSLEYPRLLTDRRTPLRGVAIPWDNSRTAQTATGVLSQDALNRLAGTYGMNALHLYLEKWDTNPDGTKDAGVNEAACDLLVDRCSKAGLYLVITIGNGNAPNLNCYMPSMDFARSFWKIYAPRYSKRTHVIYEIQNEAGPEVENIDAIMNAPDQANTPHPIPLQNMCSNGEWTETQYRNEVELYDLIRRRAPASHIMMYSWCDFDNAAKAREAVAYATAHGVDWTKTSVAVHGYVENGALEPTVEKFLAAKDNPAAITCTEVNDGARVDEVQAYERHSVGWLLFTWADNNGGCLDQLRKQFDQEGIAWKPEYGKWPDIRRKGVIPTSRGPVKINCGGGASGAWIADIGFRHGAPANPVTTAIDTSAVVDPAPEAVYQTERFGNMTYTMGGLKPGAPYAVRLHMCENYWTAPGKRLFNVSINGTVTLTNFDILATAGAAHKVLIEQFTATADPKGQIVIAFTGIVDNAAIDGIEVNEPVPPVIDR